MKNFKKQYGGVGDIVLTERGEIIKQPDGLIFEMDGPLHDSNEQIGFDGLPVKTSKGNGGTLAIVEGVLSDTTNPSKGRSNDSKNAALKIKVDKKDRLGNLTIKKAKTGSPAQIFKHIVEERDKEFKKYSKEREYNPNDKISMTSKQLNEQFANSLPTDEEIFDYILGIQEFQKDISGEDFDEEANIAKNGIHIKPENKGKFTRFAKSKDMGVQEAARHVLANKEDYSPTRVKQANFARNFGGKRQYGGIPESIDGLYEFPNQPVIVPSNEITMRGIDYPVQAIDPYTGEVLDIMQPNENYYFPNTDSVLEVPLAQGGIQRAYTPGITENEATLLRNRISELNKALQERKLSSSQRQMLTQQHQLLIDRLYGGRQLDNETIQPVSSSTPNFPQEFNTNPAYSTGVAGNPSLPISPIGQQELDRFYNQAFNTLNKTDGRVDPFQVSNEVYANIADERISQLTPSPTDVQQPSNQTNPDGTYTVKRGDWLSTIAQKYGTTTEELIKLNPQISDINKIKPGDKVNLPVQNKPATARTNAEVNGSLVEQNVDAIMSSDLSVIQNQQRQLDKIASDEEKALKEAQSRELTPSYMQSIIDRPQNINQPEIIGRYNTNIPTNELTAAANILARGITPEYLSDMISPRTLEYVEVDPTPYLDEIDSQVERAMQTIDPTSTQGQMLNISLSANALREKRNVLNRINQQNLQSRAQINNMNNQILTNADLRDDQNRLNYAQRSQQSEAAYDSFRLGLAGRLDQVEALEANTQNMFTMANMRNPNIQISPDGTVTRVKTRNLSSLIPRTKFGRFKKIK